MKEVSFWGHQKSRAKLLVSSVLLTALVCGQLPGQISAYAAETAECDVYPETNEQAAQQENASSAEELGYVPGEIIVSYEADATEADQTALAERLGEGETQASEFETGDVAVVSIAEDVTVEAAVEAALADPSVECAFPNFLLDNYAVSEGYEASGSVNGDTADEAARELGGESTSEVSSSVAGEVSGDEQSAVLNESSSSFIQTQSTTSLKDADPLSVNQWYLDAVNAEEAWVVLQDYYAQQNTKPSKVNVTVLDTGMLLTHNDLKNIYNTTNSKEAIYRGLYADYDWRPLRGDGYTNGGSTVDVSSAHGTHVAGIIAAEAGNGGILGVASGGNSSLKNSLVDLTMVDIFSITDTSSGVAQPSARYSDLMYGLAYAEKIGARVINLSLGFTKNEQNIDAITTTERIINEVIASNDCVVVCAAGNSNTDTPCYPAAFTNVVSVISVAENATVKGGVARSSFSNYGDWCDISAPGTSIYSTYASNKNTLPAYKSDSGTSMACPIVSAIAALTLAANPKLSEEQVRTILYTTATDINTAGKDDETGYGLVNAEAAVEAALSTEGTGTGKINQAGISAIYSIATKPTAVNRTYNGAVQVGVAANNTVVVSGGSATNAGTYTATVTPAAGYAWDINGNRSAIKISWKISPLSLSSSGVSAASVSSSLTFTGKALKPGVKATYAGKTLSSSTDYTVTYGANKWAGKGTITLKGKGNFTGTRTVSFTIKAKTPTVSYQTHVQKIGWQKAVTNGALGGTTGKKLRVEAFKVKLTNQSYSGGIRVKSHVQKQGWQGWKYDGALSGTTGKSLRVEAVRIELTGEMAKHYDVYYRVHIQKKGWTGWAKNGASCGSAGYSYRMEGIQIKLVAKGGKAPGSTSRTFYQKK